LPVVWKDRLFLFWLRILKSGPETAQTPVQPGKNAGDPTLASIHVSDLQLAAVPISVKAVLCWSEYYNSKWHPTKTSDVNRPTLITTLAPSGFNRDALRLAAKAEGAALRVYVNPPRPVKQVEIVDASNQSPP